MPFIDGSVNFGVNMPKREETPRRKSSVRNPSEIYTAPAGKFEEALNVIIREELRGLGRTVHEEEIWLDINTGEIEITKTVRKMLESTAKNYTDGKDGKILLWTRTEGRTISDIKNALVITGEKPFENRCFIEWYLENNFTDRIKWQ